MANLEEFLNIPALLRVILLLVFSNIYVSQSIIKTLPGFPGDLPFKLETGYIGVGEREEVQLFYYFVESERNPTNDPLMIWLNGGPGCSVLRSIFYEIGPLTFNNENPRENPMLGLNPYTWTKVANIIFLDAPVGAGFSYAKTWEAYNTSDTLSAAYTSDFLRKWLMVHPQFIPNRLFICGVSYSGIVIPIIVQEIYSGNEAGNEPLINIEGYMIGNPLTDKNSDVNSRVEFAHRAALLSDELFQSTKENCHGNYVEVDSHNILCTNDLQVVDKCLQKIYFQQILEPFCGSVPGKPNLLKWDGSSLQDNPVNLLQLPQQPWCRDNDYVYSFKWANEESVQKALNIREGTIKEWQRCNTNTFYSFGVDATSTYSFNVPSSVNYHRNLTNKHCRALIYSGDHDMVVPHDGTEIWIRSLNLTVESTWEPWSVDGQVAGYSVSYSHNDYSLTYATIKGAGHTSPEYKPKEALAMVERWFAYYPL